MDESTLRAACEKTLTSSPVVREHDRYGTSHLRSLSPQDAERAVAALWEHIAPLQAERDDLLAENESLAKALNTTHALWRKTQAQLDAFRALCDQASAPT